MTMANPVGSEKMNVAMVVETFPVLSETFVLNQISALVELGCKVTVFAWRSPNTPVVHKIYSKLLECINVVYQDPVPAKRGHKYRRASAYFFSQLFIGNYRVLLALNVFYFGRAAVNGSLLNHLAGNRIGPGFDVIHCQFGTTGRIVQMITEVAQLRGELITTFHGYDLNANDIRKSYGYYRRLFEKARAFTVNSSFSQSRLLALGCLEEKISILPVGLPISSTQPEKKLSPGKDGVKRVISIGRLTEVKGICYSLQVVSKLRTQEQIKYVIIGEGELLPELKALAYDLGVDDQVEFHGALSQESVLSLLSEADIFLYTGVIAADGSEETQGLAIQEAQAMGVPVVVWNVGGVAEGMIDGETGFMVDAGNIEKTVDKIELLLDDANLWRSMSEHASRFAKAKYDSMKLGKQLLQLYTDMIGGQRVC